MPVIVNEFEVLADTPSDGANATASPAAQPPEGQATRPEDMRRILGYIELRISRLTAD